MHVMDVRCTIVDVPKDTEWNEESKQLENIDQPNYAMSLTTPPASLILRLKKEQKVNRTFSFGVLGHKTHSALSETKRALTMKGSLGSLCEYSFKPDSEILGGCLTHCPLPKTLPYPCRRVSITGTTSELSVRPSFSSAGISDHSLSTLIVGRQWRLRVKWKWRIPTLPK